MPNRADSLSPSAALRYFQVPRDDWELLLVRMRQMGATVVSAPVPWSWHAPAPDVFDFAGKTHPQRDLLAFVELCNRLGLRVMLQPGPFHSDKLLGDDIPSWLLAQHPISSLPRACELHPTFMQHAHAWFAAFSIAFAAYQHPNGPIVALQVDAIRSADALFADTEPAPHSEWLRELGWRIPLVHAQRAAFETPVDAPHHAFKLWARNVWSNQDQEPSVRSDGSVRFSFWHIRGPLSLLNAADGDFACSHAPADLALGYSYVSEQVSQWIDKDIAEHRELVASADHIAKTQALAQRLTRAGVSFDVIDVDAASLEDLEQYRLVIMPASPVLARATQRKLTTLSHLALIGETPLSYDEQLLPCDLLSSKAITRLPERIDGATLGALVEDLGGFARYAWADADDVHVLVRHGASGTTYIYVANRRDQPYSGMLAYRTLSGEIEHVHVSLGPQREGLLLLRDNEVLGAALDSDASEGSWLVRGMHSSIVWSGGAAVVAPYNDGRDVAALLVSAPHSGRLDLRRAEAWEDVKAYRLLFDGRALPAAFRTESSHLVLPYVGEDAQGQTDAYLVLLAGETMPHTITAYLNTQLQARSSVLERNADLLAAVQQTSDMSAALRSASATLNDLVRQGYTMQQYIETLESVSATSQQIVTRLTQRLRIERGALEWVASLPATAATAIVERVLASLTRGI